MASKTGSAVRSPREGDTAFDNDPSPMLMGGGALFSSEDPEQTRHVVGIAKPHLHCANDDRERCL